jgi:iron complex transport system ATP-binding protein
VLLLDEPTSNLDVKNQLEVMGRIREVVKSEQLAAVISIHDLNLAVRFADDFVLLKDRRIRHATSRQGLTEEMIGEVYGIDVVIREVGGHPVVVPL